MIEASEQKVAASRKHDDCAVKDREQRPLWHSPQQISIIATPLTKDDGTARSDDVRLEVGDLERLADNVCDQQWQQTNQGKIFCLEQWITFRADVKGVQDNPEAIEKSAQELDQQHG